MAGDFKGTCRHRGEHPPYEIVDTPEEACDRTIWEGVGVKLSPCSPGQQKRGVNKVGKREIRNFTETVTGLHRKRPRRGTGKILEGSTRACRGRSENKLRCHLFP